MKYLKPIIIMIFALIIRIYNLYSGYGFSGNDASFFALYALGMSDLSNVFIWLGSLINFHWGLMTPLILWINVEIMNLLGIGLNEFIITLPLTLLGALNAFLIYLLGRNFFDENASLTASLIYSVLPLAVSQSRTIGGTWITGQFMLLLSLIFVIKYFKKEISYILPSFCLSLYLVSSSLFPFIIPIIAYLSLAYSYEKLFLDRLKEGFFSSLKLVIFPLIMSFPMIISWIILKSIGQPHLGYIGHMLSKEPGIGFYFANTLFEFSRVSHPSLLIIGLVGIVIGVNGIFKLDKKSIFPIWFFSYTFPFLFLISPESTVVSSYLGYALIGLIFSASDLIINFQYQNYKLTNNSKFIVLIFVLLFSLFMTLSMVHRINLLGDYDYRRGGVHENTGIKTAGLYIRDNIPDAIIFTDLEPFNLMFYSGTYIDIPPNIGYEDKLRHYSNNTNLLVLKSDNPREKFYKNAIVVSNGIPLIHIYSLSQNNATEILEISENDRKFDEKYGHLESLSQGSIDKLKPGLDHLIKKIPILN